LALDPYPLSRLGDDAYLAPYIDAIKARGERARVMEQRLTGGATSLADFASGHEYFGLHRQGDGWVFREWAPNATSICMVGTFSGWRECAEYELRRIDGQGTWEIRVPGSAVHHGDLYRLRVRWSGGEGDRIPAYARRVVQDTSTNIFNAQAWEPEHPYVWKHPTPPRPVPVPLIYEAHVGMAQEHAGVGTYSAFTEKVLPRIVKAGYNVVQLMALMEHPYYGSFGYHVSSFFAASSRFGTPEELKALVDAVHGAGLTLIMDLIHSHAGGNVVE